ncbi:pyridoxamine 5'-phosphate oxidase family protein [Methylorubrum thiocyanatum]|uniref:pyridoxamine 5'-phosphate oxidase family protein n=1 Tax=Methylorubrum thiocyanatum TaxID=47958 RepID=UPI00383A02A4
MLFLSTVDATGQPTVSYKGGATGFVRIDGDDLLPCYDGNGMFLSMGNVTGEAHVGLFFIDFETPRRLRVHGIARLNETVPVPGAAMVMRISPTQIFLNCPRYVHRYRREDSSRYVPDARGNAPVAEWKRLAFLQEDLLQADRESVAAVGTITQSEYDAKVGTGDGQKRSELRWSIRPLPRTVRPRGTDRVGSGVAVQARRRQCRLVLQRAVIRHWAQRQHWVPHGGLLNPGACHVRGRHYSHQHTCSLEPRPYRRTQAAAEAEAHLGPAHAPPTRQPHARPCPVQLCRR